MRSFATFYLAALLFPMTYAQPPKAKDTADDLPRIPPRVPEESAKLFEIHPAFRIELAAGEPLVQSPAAAEFDEDGRLFVVELPEYNQYGSKKPHGKGRVVMLEDLDGDGKFDKRTIVVDHLDYPTAVFPWDGGVFVGAAPHLLYCKGDKQTVILSGFGSDKAGEGHLNSFRWSLDNRILISTGIDGGDIVRQGVKDDKPVSVRRLNILFDPRTGKFETVSGGGQHGLTFDDWGNTFVCGNSEPCHHLVYDTRYLANSPSMQAPPPAVNIAPGGKFTKLHRISEVEPWRMLRTKLRKDGTVPGSDEGGQPSGFFTGATGITVYRGDAFPKEFQGNAFVGEVANNLVYRAKLVPKGVTFVAERADAEKEFLASKDIWHRPVQFINAPDGCLYVLDMYRELIEGAAFLAPPILKHVDPSAGIDKGRIWRIAPKDFKQPKPPKLSTATTEELVKLLEHPNGWHRDTAARLLYQRQDPKFMPIIKKESESNSPLGRLHEMYAIEGAAKGQIDPAIALDGENTLQRKIRSSLKDADPRVLAHALRLAERHKVYFSDDEMISLAKHKDIGVRYQLLWFLSGSDLDAGEVLTNLVKQDHADAWMRLAIICAATSKSAGLDRLDFIAEPDLRKTADGRAFIETLVETAGATPNRYVGTAAMRGISRLREDDVGFQFQLLGALVRRASEQNLALLRKNDAKGLFMQLRERAMETAQDSKASEADRVSAIRALAIQSYEELQPIFTISLKPTQPRAVQIAALELLSRVGPIEAPDLLLKIWPSLSPAVRATATEVFLSRANWLQAFLEAVEKGKIARADIDPARVGLLMKSPNRSVRVQVEELFGKVVTKRKDVVDYYQPSLTLKGDPLKGKAIFKKECAACHKLEGVGEEIGADLKAIRDRGTENMLLNILDPNREVKPQFLAYSLETTAGKTLSGMLTAETPNSVTIRLLDGRSEIVPRAEIDSLRSTGLSFMPEGLEKQIDKQAMADLLAYLNSIK